MVLRRYADWKDVMEKWGKRMEDKGHESLQVMLARIDERTKNMNDKLVAHMVSFEVHKIDDDKNFKGLYRWVFIGVGIVCTLQFVVLATKH